MRFFAPRCSYIWICFVAAISQAVCQTCPPLKSDGVDIACDYGGITVSCETPSNPGTKARLACKPSYKIPLGSDPGYRELRCLDEGVWDRFLFNCIPECGMVLAEGKPFIINGFASKSGFPWHVGVYLKTSAGTYIQVCGGTLVSPDLVVSAAHCFYDDRYRTIANAKDYAVAAGKRLRSYDAPEPFAQKTMVQNISIPKRYFGLGGNYAQDISLLRLEFPFEITTLVRPVCMDWENDYERVQLQERNSGKIVGWGRNAAGIFSEELQEINLPFVHYDACFYQVPDDFRSFITPDKFCAGYLNGSSLCDGDSGGGLCFQLEGRWYLRGIVSVGAVDRMGMCDRNYYTAFTNVGLFLNWIREVYFNWGTQNRGQLPLNFVPTTPSCIIPVQPKGGSFVLDSCEGDCKVVPGTRVPLGSFLTYKCNEGYTLSGNNISFCYEAGWYLPPTCIEKVLPKYCPDLISKSGKFDCTYQGKTVPCTSQILPGTKAILGCKKFYHIPSPDPGYTEITCLENHSWDHNAFDCDPDCGTALPREAKLYDDGFEVPHGTFPWRMLLYQKNSTVDYQLLSYAILIRPDLAITPAFRVVKVAAGKTVVLDPNDFVVIAGQGNTKFNNLEVYTQHSQVKHIEIAPGYVAVLRRRLNNIALLRLATPLDMTELVRLVCLDWDNRVTREVFENSKMDEVGESRDVSESQDIHIPFYSNKDCRKRIRESEENLLRNETFCTDCLTEKVGYDLLDMGYGFHHQSRGIWYLIGYLRVTTSLRDSSCRKLYTFEKLEPLLDWIRTFYNMRTG